MQVISDLPPFVIDQILGSNDVSYLAVKLWLCGDKNLQDKLAKGLTLLELTCHPFGSFLVPQMVTELRALRRFSIFTADKDGMSNNSVEDWPKLMRSLPNTLESLGVHSYFPFYENLDKNDNPIVTTYPRGASSAIELETLFPRLHTLILTAREEITSDLFPALPSSLTHLGAVVVLKYHSETKHFSRLPPGLQHLKGLVTWDLDPSSRFSMTNSDEAIDTIRLDCLNAPPTLQTLTTGANLRWAKDDELLSSSYDCWLPRSLLEIDWSLSECPRWSPTLARTVPPNLTSLKLGDIDVDSFGETYTNWVADLPRTLTKLYVEVPFDSQTNDFVDYGRFLPVGLTDLTLVMEGHITERLYGDWSTINGIDYWPSKLTRLNLSELWMEPSDLVMLPTTLKILLLSISSDRNYIPTLHTNQLPSSLTVLHIHWTDMVINALTFTALTSLKECSLKTSGEMIECEDIPFDRFPASLVSLTLEGLLTLESPQDDQKVSELPNLRTLVLEYGDCNLFEHLPRGLTKFSVDGGLSGLEEAPFLPTGELFKDLPSSLTHLTLNGLGQDGFPLPPQDFDHLTSLTDLGISIIPSVSSGMLRKLPRKLKSLVLNIEELDEKDLPFLPPGLTACNIGTMTPEIVKSMTLASLASLKKHKGEEEDDEDDDGLDEEFQDIARERVLQAAIHQ